MNDVRAIISSEEGISRAGPQLRHVKARDKPHNYERPGSIPAIDSSFWHEAANKKGPLEALPERAAGGKLCRGKNFGLRQEALSFA